MISHYKYFGYKRIKNDGRYIWGAVSYVENGNVNCYVFWGSPKNPIIKKYQPFDNRSQKQELYYKIKERKKPYSGYIEICQPYITTAFPDLESQIGMYILAKKLKSNV